MSSHHADIMRWKDDALKVQPDEVRVRSVPLHVVFGEAVDVAKFVDNYWAEEKDGDGKVVHPGLRSALKKRGGSPRLSAKTGEEILSLQRAAQDAQTKYLLSVGTKDASDPVGRGRYLVAEITATLDWLFDDGVEDEKDAQLEKVAAAHADDPETTDALASALDDFAGLAEPHAKEMDGLGGFEVKFIAEARTLAAELRARPTQAVEMSRATRNALALRDGLVTLLLDRMALVRSAARFVFRRQSEIARLATSSYERRRRAGARKGKAGGTTTPPANGSGGTVTGGGATAPTGGPPAGGGGETTQVTKS